MVWGIEVGGINSQLQNEQLSIQPREPQYLKLSQITFAYLTLHLPGRTAPDIDYDATSTGPGSGGLRRKREADPVTTAAPPPKQEHYSGDDVFYVSPLPRVSDGVLQASIIVKEPDNGLQAD